MLLETFLIEGVTYWLGFSDLIYEGFERKTNPNCPHMLAFQAHTDGRRVTSQLNMLTGVKANPVIRPFKIVAGKRMASGLAGTMPSVLNTMLRVSVKYMLSVKQTNKTF